MADAVKDELLLLCCNEVLGIRNIASSLANPRKLLVSTSYQAQLSASPSVGLKVKISLTFESFTSSFVKTTSGERYLKVQRYKKVLQEIDYVC